MVLPHLHAQMHHVLPSVGLFQFGVVFWGTWRHLMINDGLFFSSLGAMGVLQKGATFFLQRHDEDFSASSNRWGSCATRVRLTRESG